MERLGRPDVVVRHDPAAAKPGRLLTFAAQDADVRRLLPLLAEAADVSLVLSPDVQGRVSVYFRDVPALEALQTVIEEAGLSVSTGRLEAPWGPAVFYRMPVNVNTASAETIRSAFDVSATLAEWVVAARLPERETGLSRAPLMDDHRRCDQLMMTAL